MAQQSGTNTNEDGGAPGPPAYELVVIGTSLGGGRALEIILSGLPRDFPLPVAIVLHRRPDSGLGLAHMLQRFSTLPVVEPEDKAAAAPGAVYLAPADYHLLVDEDVFVLSNDEPINYSRPSIDALFEAAADARGSKVIGVLLTGNSADGAAGLGAIKRRGGLTLTQDPATAEAPVMPQAAIAAGGVDRIMPLEEIAPFLARICRPGPGEK